MTTTIYDGSFDMDDLIAMPAQKAAALAQITMRRLNWWNFKDVVRPSIRKKVSARTEVRLYTFADLEGLLVAAQLRRRLSLQQIRGVVQHLNSRGYGRPLSELQFAIHRDEILFRHPDGTWEGDKFRDQTVIEMVLVDMERIRASIRNGLGRSDSTHGRIERKRGRLGRKPVFAGTRIPVSTVTRRLALGQSDREILQSYPDLTEKDIAKARELASV